MEASYALTAFAVGIIVSYLVAEFIGRQKHIGGWWSFFVVLSSLPFLFIPGLIAVFASPSAKREPTEDSDWILFPGVLILVASFFCFLTFIDLKIAHSRISLTWLSWAISTLVLGSYITILGWGKIKNVRPKFRENVLGAWISSKIKMAGKSTKLNFRNPSIINETLYYIVEDGMPVGPFALQQVKDKQLKAGTLVCRNGEQKWSAVEEMNELYPYVIFPPPPVFDIHNRDDDRVISYPSIPYQDESILNEVYSKKQAKKTNNILIADIYFVLIIISIASFFLILLNM